jgi:two-component system alkaline phosphatase synthesis response regulator PhoP
MPDKILVVDDEPNIRELLHDRLTVAGYKVVSAASGMEALTMAKTETPQLIILDMMLPDIQGSSVCAQIKSDEILRFIPVVLLTARDRDYDKDIGRAVKADAYITKPFDHQVLMAKIRELLVREK